MPVPEDGSTSKEITYQDARDNSGFVDNGASYWRSNGSIRFQTLTFFPRTHLLGEKTVEMETELARGKSNEKLLYTSAFDHRRLKNAYSLKKS